MAPLPGLGEGSVGGVRVVGSVGVTLTEQQSRRYQTFHSKGRWQGLPTRVAEGEEPLHFEPVPGLDAAPEGAPDVLIFGVPNTGMMPGQPTNVILIAFVGDPARRLTLIDTGLHDAFDSLRNAFVNSGIDMQRVERVVLTHCH